MNNSTSRIQTTKLEQVYTVQLIDRLLMDLEQYPKASIERIDRVALIKNLVEYQHALRGEEMAARRELFLELRPRSAPIDGRREPTLDELQAIDWDDLDCVPSDTHSDVVRTVHRRQQLLQHFAGRGSLKDMFALIAKHRCKSHSRLELWPTETGRSQLPPTLQLTSKAA